MNTTIDLTPRPPQAIEVAGEDPLEILRYAVDKKAAVDVIERMMAVRRELNAEKAKQAFDKALSDFQNECPVIKKTKKGARDAYKYAPLDAIIVQTRDLIRKHGFSFRLTSECGDGFVKAVLSLSHVGGHTETSEFKCPIDTKNPMMTEPQRYGGAMTFAKRYAFCNALGIMTSDEDLDGGPRPQPQGPSSVQDSGDRGDAELKRELVDLTRQAHGVSKGVALNPTEKDKLTAWLITKGLISDTQTVSDLRGEQLKTVVEAVRKGV